ncbi:MAG: hypothetical protein ACRDN9_01245 [Streptosporangiaceae bacterium]
MTDVKWGRVGAGGFGGWLAGHWIPPGRTPAAARAGDEPTMGRPAADADLRRGGS